MKRGVVWKAARDFRRAWALWSHKATWYRQNPHNETRAVNLFDARNVCVGRYSYGPLRVIDGFGENRLIVGDFCSIAEDVTFVLDGEHRLGSLSSFPLRALVLGERSEPTAARRDIVLDHDVWIGHGAVVLSGVSIGRGAVVAAGAVVRSDVAPYSIVGGVPAKSISERFPAPMVKRLLKLDFSVIDAEFVRRHISALEEPLTEQALAEIHGLMSSASPRTAPVTNNEGREERDQRPESRAHRS